LLKSRDPKKNITPTSMKARQKFFALRDAINSKRLEFIGISLCVENQIPRLGFAGVESVFLATGSPRDGGSKLMRSSTKPLIFGLIFANIFISFI